MDKYTIEKDKNIITLTIDGWEYRFDLNNGDMWSKNRKVKNFPKAITLTILAKISNNGKKKEQFLELLLEVFYERCLYYPAVNGSFTCNYAIAEYCFLVAERQFLPRTMAEYCYNFTINKKEKEFIKIFADLYNSKCDFYLNDVQRIIDAKIDYFDFKKKYSPLLKEQIGRDSIFYYPDIWLYYQNKHCFPYDIEQYLSDCRLLNKKPLKESNWKREFEEAKKSAQLLFSRASYSELFPLAYEKQREAWDFEYGNYCVKIPYAAQDLIREGSEMKHCVGRYIDKVANNTTYIVFIRKKNDPDTPYITGEVNVYGKITKQWFYKYDKTVDLPQDIEFKETYQKYLNKVWKI